MAEERPGMQGSETTAAAAVAQWIGPPTVQIAGRSFFKTFENSSGESISTGDFCYLLPSSNNPTADLRIARIESMYEDEKGIKCMHVRWFYGPKDLQHNPPVPSKQSEIYHTNYFDSWTIESVVRKCRVVRNEDHDSMTKSRHSSRLAKGKQSHGEVHVCRFTYSVETGEFETVPNFDQPYLDAMYKNTDEPDSEQNTVLNVKGLIRVLLKVEQHMTMEAKDQWPAKRLVWIQKAKKAVLLEDVKEVFLDLQNEFQAYGFKKRNSFKATSCKELLNHIKHFKHEVQKKACATALIQRNVQHHEEQKRKKRSISIKLPSFRRKTWMSSTDSLQRRSPGIMQAGSVYEIDGSYLPSDAPTHLKALRAVVVSETTEHKVTIKFPSISSLGAHFESPSYRCKDIIPHERVITRQLFLQPDPVATSPVLDQQFVMTYKVAERVLKQIVPSADFDCRGHLKDFWLCMNITGDDDACIATSQQENLRRERVDKKMGSLSVPLSILPERHHSEMESPLISHDKILRMSELQDRADASDFKTSENLCAIKHTDDMQNAECVVVDSPSRGLSQMKPNTALPVGSPLSEDKSIPHWGIRKKISSRYTCLRKSLPSANLGASHVEKHQVQFPASSKFCKDNAEPKADADKSNAVQCKVTDGQKGFLKVPKDMEGRWSSERYKAAQLKLIDILHEKSAVPGKPLLRPALRKEARKYIGDTGLLDHLLKHMTDSVVCANERFCRRHNSEGTMEYWLEDSSLTELRRKAGVDRFWVPPSGWKPGDLIPGKFCGALPTNQSEEMRRIKDDVENLKSQMQYFSQRMQASLVISDNASLKTKRYSGSWEKFQQNIKDQILDMRKDILKVREAVNNYQEMYTKQSSEPMAIEQAVQSRVLEKQANMGSRKSSGLGHCGIQEHLEKIDDDIRKLAEVDGIELIAVYILMRCLESDNHIQSVRIQTNVYSES